MTTPMRSPSEFSFAHFGIDTNTTPLKNGRGVFLNTTYKDNGFNKKVRLQTPKLRAPFGLSRWSDGESEKLTLSLSLEPLDGNDKEVQAFYEWLERLDAVIVQHVFEHQTDLFPHLKQKGQRLSRDTILQLYSGLVRPSQNADFAPTTRIKVQEVFGKWPSVYDAQREKVGYESIQKGCQVIGIVELGSIWVSATQLTASLRLVQLQVIETPAAPVDEDIFMFDNGQFED